jgi:signal transduction histidine kinase
VGGKIRIHLARLNDRIRIDIADNGIGIAEEALPHLFERFYKADKARDRTGSGSGLGLSIVKKIIDMHEGEVYAQSRPNEGAEFTVVMPSN